MEQIRNWRIRAGITSVEAARLAGVSQAQWSRYENGLAPVGAKRTPKLSEITGIPRHELRPDLYEAAQ